MKITLWVYVGSVAYPERWTKDPVYCERKMKHHIGLADLAAMDGSEMGDTFHLAQAKAWEDKLKELSDDLDGQVEIREAARMRLAAEFSGEED